MTRRRTSSMATPEITVKRLRSTRDTAFARWIEETRKPFDVIASELDVTTHYVRILAAGKCTPSAKLRLRIQALSRGAVMFDAW